MAWSLQKKGESWQRLRGRSSSKRRRRGGCERKVILTSVCSSKLGRMLVGYLLEPAASTRKQSVSSTWKCWAMKAHSARFGDTLCVGLWLYRRSPAAGGTRRTGETWKREEAEGDRKARAEGTVPTEYVWWLRSTAPAQTIHGLCMDVCYWQDQTRREDELNELRHLLEENHTAVTTWKRDAMEKAKVCLGEFLSIYVHT